MVGVDHFDLETVHGAVAGFRSPGSADQLLVFLPVRKRAATGMDDDQSMTFPDEPEECFSHFRGQSLALLPKLFQLLSRRRSPGNSNCRIVRMIVTATSNRPAADRIDLEFGRGGAPVVVVLAAEDEDAEGAFGSRGREPERGGQEGREDWFDTCGRTKASYHSVGEPCSGCGLKGMGGKQGFEAPGAQALSRDRHIFTAACLSRVIVTSSRLVTIGRTFLMSVGVQQRTITRKPGIMKSRKD